MQKILTGWLVIVTLFLTACTTETNISSATLSKDTFIDSIEINQTKSLSVKLTNTSETGTLNWVLTEQTALAGSYSLKVDRVTKGNTGSIELRANTSATFTVDFTPTANGTGVYNLIFTNAEGTTLARTNFTVIAYPKTIIPPAPLFTLSREVINDTISTPVNATSVDIKFDLVNNTSNPLDIKWIRENERGSNAIEIYLCDFQSCFGPNVKSNSTENDVPLTAGQSVPMKFQMEVPGSSTFFSGGTKTIDLRVFVPSDSANTVKVVKLNFVVQ